MPWNTLPTYATGAVLTSPQLNASIGAGGDLDQTATAIVTTAGDMVQATGSKALARIAAVATGNVPLSGGVGTAFSWGKVSIAHLASLKICDLNRNTNQSLTTGTWTALSWDAENVDASGWHDPVTNPTRITPTTAGYCLVLAYARFAASTAGTQRAVRVTKNGSFIQVFEEPPAASANLQGLVCYAARSVNGSTDYFEVEASQDSGGNLNAIGQVIVAMVGAS